MGIKIVKGVAGQVDSLQSVQNKASQSARSGAPNGAASKAAQFASATSDAVVTTLRSGRPESSERLTLDKAEKLAKSLKDDISSDKELAMAAVDGEYSISAVRDAFGV